MIPKIRINDLARELEVRSRDILDLLPTIGVIEKKTHSSSVEVDEAERVRQHFSAQRENSTAGNQMHGRPAARVWLSHISKPGEVLRAIQQKTQSAAVDPALPVAAKLAVSSVPPAPVRRPVIPTVPAGTTQPPTPEAPPPQAAAGTIPDHPANVVPSSPQTRIRSSLPGQTVEFSFMKDLKLREIAERDYLELRKLKSVGAVKSRFILMGGLLEAFLVDALLPRSGDASETRAAKNEDGKIDRWRLASLINAAVDLELVRPGVRNLSHQVRDFRNLIHPGFERRTKYDVRRQEAEIAEQILHVVIEDLRALSGQ